MKPLRTILVSLVSLVAGKPQSLVLTPLEELDTTTTTTTETTTTEEAVAGEPVEVVSFHITSKVQLRYARTVVESRVRNMQPMAQTAQFTVIIPEKAFVSGFSMEINGTLYEARVEEKEKAEQTFKKAVMAGQGSGLVSQDTRDATKFTVSTSVEGSQEVTFRLTYEELLDRTNGLYEQVINIAPEEVVDDFRVEIFINESLPITKVSVPELLESNEIDFEQESENSIATVERNFEGDNKTAKIVFSPTRAEQEAAAGQGVSGKLVVRYDVDRQGQASEVQVIDGYFVHYFVPEDLPTLPKHTVFILDISGSMAGEKLQQLKDAMFTVLDAMKATDFFNIITFSSDVGHWVADKRAAEENLAIAATEENKKKAIEYVLDLQADGGTNINEAILGALSLAEGVLRKEELPQGTAAMLIFLSDGEASEGETSSGKIQSNIATANSQLQLPIFSVAFGSGADFGLLKDISVSAGAFAKRVYEGSDAALQLENFYTEISSPVVTRLRFDYVGDQVDNSSLSETEVKTVFGGGSYLVVGRLEESATGSLEVTVTGEDGGEGYFDHIVIAPCPIFRTVEPASSPLCIPIEPKPVRSEAQEFMQGLHAFLNIQQLLKKDMKEEAVELALANHFVTPVTSLVVVRPDEDDTLAEVEEEVPGYDYGLAVMAFAAPSRFSYNSYGSPVSAMMDYAYDSYADYDYSPTSTTAAATSTTTPASTCSGHLTLHSSTYHRGEEVTLTSSSADLGAFSDRAVSAVVVGSCCWTLYSAPGYSGETATLTPGGDYRTTNSFGRSLFREVSSVQRVLC